jgi:hypothetical protein
LPGSSLGHILSQIAISALFQKSLPPSEVQELIDALQHEGHITLDGEAITYHLPHS